MRILTLLIFILGFSCSQKVNNSTSESNPCIENKDGSYSLCKEVVVSAKKATEKYATFSLIDKEGNVAWKETIDNGDVKWLDNMAIEIVRIPGNIMEGADVQDFTTVYLIESKQTLSKKDYLESKE